MGVIYSGAELAAGHIPITGDHERAALAVIERIPKLAGTVLTMVHGSVPKGHSNCRSDLDVLVTYSFDDAVAEPMVIDDIKMFLDEISEETAVKVEANIWPVSEPVAARAERMYDLLFSHHLAKSMENDTWVVGDPDEQIRAIAGLPLDHERMKRLMFNYMTYKHAGFTKAPRDFEEGGKPAMAALQRALEFPKAAGRKVAQLTRTVLEVPVDNYQAVLSEAEVSPDLLRVIESLRTIDRTYSSILEDYSNRDSILTRADIEEYTSWIEGNYPLALSLGIVAATGFTHYIDTL